MKFESRKAELGWLREHPPECKAPGTDNLKPRARWIGLECVFASYRELGYCERCPRQGTEHCLFPPQDRRVIRVKEHHHWEHTLDHDEVVERLIEVLEEHGEIKVKHLRGEESPISYAVVWRRFGGIEAARVAVQRQLERRV